MRLSGNFRSAPEVVAAVNAIGEALLDALPAAAPSEPRRRDETAGARTRRSSCC